MTSLIAKGAIPKDVRVTDVTPYLTLADVRHLSVPNPAETEARHVRQAEEHRVRLEAICAEHWGDDG